MGQWGLMEDSACFLIPNITAALRFCSYGTNYVLLLSFYFLLINAFYFHRKILAVLWVEKKNMIFTKYDNSIISKIKIYINFLLCLNSSKETNWSGWVCAKSIGVHCTEQQKIKIPIVYFYIVLNVTVVQLWRISSPFRPPSFP